MNKKILFLLVICVLTCVSIMYAVETEVGKTILPTGPGFGDLATIMVPDEPTLMAWYNNYLEEPEYDFSPIVSAPPSALPKSHNILKYLDYKTTDRNQYGCGNCWVWTGQGIMGLEVHRQFAKKERISVQHLQSCCAHFGCCGGDMFGYTTWHTKQKYFIPWSNYKASFADKNKECVHKKSDVACASILKNPKYDINKVTSNRIPTFTVTSAQAKENIKKVLLQNKGVSWGFSLPNKTEWDKMKNHWYNKTEYDVWNPQYICSLNYDRDKGAGTHYVLIVGYNESHVDPTKHTWIVLNSWGTANGKRPNGLFRIPMDLQYTCQVIDGDNKYYTYWFETFDVDWKTTSLDSWISVYGSIFDEPDHLDVLRAYRDNYLEKSNSGKKYVDVIYRNSESALNLLLDNPQLLTKTNDLINRHIDAVISVLQQGESDIYNTDSILSYLSNVQEKSSGELLDLVTEIIEEIEFHREHGEPFLGLNFVQ